MRQLTVPVAQLPSGCVLAGNRRFAAEGNPWMGSDAPALARIRERMEGTPAVPDAPPLAKRAAARYVLHWADGVDEGYSATYATTDREIVVHALRFAAGAARPRVRSAHERARRIEIGSIVAFVYGNDGDCSRAIAAYLESL